MPQKSKAKTNFTGAGRKFGSGDTVTPPSQKDDFDYEHDSDDVTDSEGEFDSKEEELAREEAIAFIGTAAAAAIKRSEGQQLHSTNDHLPNDGTDSEEDEFVDAIDLKGHIFRVLKSNREDGDEGTKEQSVEIPAIAGVQLDVQGKQRYTIGLNFHQAISALAKEDVYFQSLAYTKGQIADQILDGKIPNLSTEAIEKKAFRKAVFKMEACPRGTYIATVSAKGTLQYEQLKQNKLNKLARLEGDGELRNILPDSPCGFSVCTRRQKHGAYHSSLYGRTESRSGQKRGWFRYGEGHVLGEGEGEASAEEQLAKRRK